MKPVPHAHAMAGLTLIEMLVVLMIAGMALALGYQSLSQWRIAETSLSGVSDRIREQRLGQAWFETSIRALVPVSDAPFAGDGRTLSGLTLSPPVATPGGTTSIRWTVVDERGVTMLALEEHGEEQLLLPLDGARTAHFEYLDPDGEVHAQWPPSQGLHHHLPAAVVLVRGDGDAGETFWAASVSGDPDPPQILQMYEPDSD